MKYELGAGFRYDGPKASLSGETATVELRRTPGRVLEVFLRRPGEVITYDEVCREVWGGEIRSQENLRQNLAAIRRAFSEVGLDPNTLRTVRNRGIALDLPVRQEPPPPDEPLPPTSRPDTSPPAPRSAPSENGVAQRRQIVSWTLVGLILLAMVTVTVVAVRLPGTPPGARPATIQRQDSDRARRVRDRMPMVRVPAGPFQIGLTRDAAERLIDQALGEGLTRSQATGLIRNATLRGEGGTLEPMRVTLPEFWIDVYPVTNAQYRLFVDATGHRPPEHGIDPARYTLWKNGRHPAELAEHPVVNVSWHDAHAYCAWVGARLPTDFEWEKSARGTDGRLYPWGDLWARGFANTGMRQRRSTISDPDGEFARTTPVGYFPAGVSPYGVFDLSGNVWEWTAEWYGLYRSDPPVPTMRVGRGRTMRGGGWTDVPAAVSAVIRAGDEYLGEYRDTIIGFRCAAGPEQLESHTPPAPARP